MNLSMNHKEDTQFVAGIITVNKHPEMPQYKSFQVNNSTVFWAPFPTAHSLHSQGIYM